jgi:hypothetical protein
VNPPFNHVGPGQQTGPYVRLCLLAAASTPARPSAEDRRRTSNGPADDSPANGLRGHLGPVPRQATLPLKTAPPYGEAEMAGLPLVS